MDECSICITEEKLDIYYECDHKICLKCSNFINKCPYCRKNKITHIDMQILNQRNGLNLLNLIDIIDTINIEQKNNLDQIINKVVNNNNFIYRGYKKNINVNIFVFTFDNINDIINLQKSDKFEFIIENKGYISYDFKEKYIIFGIKY